MKLLVMTLAALGVIMSGSALGQAGSEVLRARGCTSCHDSEKTRVGPSLKDIRAKYRGDTSKAAEIVARMKEGKGHPKLSVSDAELKAAVDAALAAK